MRRRPDLSARASGAGEAKGRTSTVGRAIELAILLVLAVGIIVAYFYGQDLYRTVITWLRPPPSTTQPQGEQPPPIDQNLDPNDEAASLLDLSRVPDGVPTVDIRVATPVASPVTIVTRISYQIEEEGGTEVVLWGDGSFSALSTSLLRLEGDAPRELVRVGGIQAPHPIPSYTLDSPEVTGLEVGYHVAQPFNELQLVADLGSPQVQLVSVVVLDRRLILRFERVNPRRRR